MLERRQQPRNRVYYGGMVAFNAPQLDARLRRAQLQPCSAQRSNLRTRPLSPDEVDFEIERKGISCLARLVWRDRDAAGLVFSNVHETSDVVPLDLGAQAARQRTGQPAAPVAPRSASDPSI